MAFVKQPLLKADLDKETEICECSGLNFPDIQVSSVQARNYRANWGLLPVRMIE